MNLGVVNYGSRPYQKYSQAVRELTINPGRPLERLLAAALYLEDILPSMVPAKHSQDVRHILKVIERCRKSKRLHMKTYRMTAEKVLYLRGEFDEIPYNKCVSDDSTFGGTIINIKLD